MDKKVSSQTIIYYADQTEMISFEGGTIHCIGGRDSIREHSEIEGVKECC